MTGPEHYKRAEKLLSGLTEIREALDPQKGSIAEMAAGAAIIDGYIAEAQVHATLALVAASVEAGGLTESGSLGVPLYPSWVKAVRPA